MLFKKKDDNLTPIKREKIELEKSLQNLTENNLEIVFGLNLADEF